MKCAGLVQSSSVLFYLQNQICSSSANDFNRQRPGGIPGTVPFKNKLLSACSQPHIENGYLVKSKLAFFLSCHGLCFSNSLCHYGEEDSISSPPIPYGIVMLNTSGGILGGFLNTKQICWFVSQYLINVLEKLWSPLKEIMADCRYRKGEAKFSIRTQQSNTQQPIIPPQAG